MIGEEFYSDLQVNILYYGWRFNCSGCFLFMNQNENNLNAFIGACIDSVSLKCGKHPSCIIKTVSKLFFCYRVFGTRILSEIDFSPHPQSRLTPLLSPLPEVLLHVILGKLLFFFVPFVSVCLKWRQGH